MAEYLIDIDLNRIGLKAVIPEHNPHGFVLGEFLDQLFRHALVETGDQVIGRFTDEKDCLALDGFFSDRQG